MRVAAGRERAAARGAAGHEAPRRRGACPRRRAGWGAVSGVLLLAAYAGGCRPANALTREVAAEKIAAVSPIRDTVKAEVWRNAGNVCRHFRAQPTQSPMPVWATLESAGLIRLVDTLPPVDPSATQPACVPLLTRKGEQAARDQRWQETSRPGFLGVRDHHWIVPMAQRRVAEVTGVTVPAEGGSTAEALFTWRWTLLTGGTPAPGLLPGEGGTGRAVLTRFDDGWRATGVALDGGRGR